MFNHLIERDPTVLNLEADLFKSIGNISKETDSDFIEPKPKEVSFFSVEDAIKELIKLQKKE